MPNELDEATQLIRMKLLELIGTTGGGNYSGRTQNLDFYVYAYARTSRQEASRVYQAIYDGLHAQALRDESGVLQQQGLAVERARPFAGFNEQIQAHFWRGTWRANLAG